MHDVSERSEYESCRYRVVPHPEDQNGAAVCRLIQEITELPETECRVGTDVCTACCRAPWPSGRRMNSVVASVIYATADKLQSDGAETVEPDRLDRLKQLSMNYLDVLPLEPAKRIVPARATRTCCYLGGPLPADGGNPRFKCHHPAHDTTTEDQCRRCRDWAVSPLAQRLPLPVLVPPPASCGGPRVRNWAVGITTAPRREPTLGICADAVIRAGWERPQLFVDAGSQIPKHLRSLPGTWRDQRIGAWPNFFLALAELVQTHPQADAFMLLQDDAYLYDTDNVREYLEQVLWPGPEPGLVSLL